MKHNIGFSLIALFLFAFGCAPAASAAPLFRPGETLDPNCSPTNADCTVLLPWMMSGSNIYSSIGSVGISTTTPSKLFSVAGDAVVTGILNAGTLSVADASTTRVNLGIGYASLTDTANNITIAAWGDSLTAGTGGKPWPSQFSDLSNWAAYNGGVGGETSTQIKTRMLAATSTYSWPTVIWAGRNNFASPDTVKSDIAAMVAALGHQKYLVLGVINGNGEPIGTANYNTIVQLNQDLAATYGSHFIDMRAYLVSQYDSSMPQDVSDHANDFPPSSLRSDGIHLNSAGYLKVARKINEKVSILIPEPQKVIGLNSVYGMFGSAPVIGSITPNLGYFSKVGIGNQAPTEALEVTGNMRLSGQIMLSPNLYFKRTGDGFGIHVKGLLVPDVDNGYDLGYNSSQFRWRNLYMRGSVYAGQGATTTPSYTFSGDSDTGIYSPASNALALVGGGTEAVRLTDAGNLGIGTTTPSQRVEVNGGMRLNTATARPTCDSTTRGTFWFTNGDAGVADAVAVCGKNSAGSYSWASLVAF